MLQPLAKRLFSNCYDVHFFGGQVDVKTVAQALPLTSDCKKKHLPLPVNIAKATRERFCGEMMNYKLRMLFLSSFAQLPLSAAFSLPKV
jgi:hypothetical protein